MHEWMGLLVNAKDRGRDRKERKQERGLKIVRGRKSGREMCASGFVTLMYVWVCVCVCVCVLNEYMCTCVC